MTVESYSPDARELLHAYGKAVIRTNIALSELNSNPDRIFPPDNLNEQQSLERILCDNMSWSMANLARMFKQRFWPTRPVLDAETAMVAYDRDFGIFTRSGE